MVNCHNGATAAAMVGTITREYDRVWFEFDGWRCIDRLTDRQTDRDTDMTDRQTKRLSGVQSSQHFFFCFLPISFSRLSSEGEKPTNEKAEWMPTMELVLFCLNGSNDLDFLDFEPLMFGTDSTVEYHLSSLFSWKSSIQKMLRLPSVPPCLVLLAWMACACALACPWWPWTPSYSTDLRYDDDDDDGTVYASTRVAAKEARGDINSSKETREI